MAKVTGPLFSMVASGTLAGTITYVCGHFARIKNELLTSAKEMPAGQQDKFLEAVAVWNSLSGNVKDDWRNFGKIVRDSKVCVSLDYYLTNYQLFLSYYLTWGKNG